MTTKRLDGTNPGCFTDEQWELWGKGEFPCHDCTPQYQKKMMIAGRCSFPRVTFVWRPMNTEFGQATEWEELMGVKSSKAKDKIADPRDIGPYRVVC